MLLNEEYRVSLRCEAVLLHKHEHFHNETFVVCGVMISRAAVHRHHCGQVSVIMIRTARGTRVSVLMAKELHILEKKKQS